jgi:tRNA(Ile2) C34 agmatinyltransferase TiaS
VNTLTIAEREPDAYDRTPKCEHCHRIMFQFGEDRPWRCPHEGCPGYAETHPQEPTDG